MKTVKTIALVTSVAFSSVAMAGAYVNIKSGVSFGNDISYSQPSDTANSKNWITDNNESSAVNGLYAGYLKSVSQRLALGGEIGYSQLSKESINHFSTVYYPNLGTTEQHKYTTSYKSKMYTFQAKAKYKLNNRFNVIAGAGVANVKYTTSSSYTINGVDTGISPLSGSFSEIQPMMSLSANLMISEHLSYGIDYTKVIGSGDVYENLISGESFKQSYDILSMSFMYSF